MLPADQSVEHCASVRRAPGPILSLSAVVRYSLVISGAVARIQDSGHGTKCNRGKCNGPNRDSNSEPFIH